MRTFIAINLPNNIRDYLASLQQEIQNANNKSIIKWVEYENLHLTLLFLDDLTDDQLATTKFALSTINWPERFDLLLDKVGAFPNDFSPQVLKVSTQGEPRLHKLYNVIKKTLGDLNITLNEKSFSPHITLGRIKNNIGKLNYETMADYLKFTVNSVDLMTSELGSAGPSYSIEEKYQLN